MARQETLDTVTKIFRAGESHNGCTDASWVAKQISEKTGYPDIDRLVWETQRIRSGPDLYPGAYETVKDLVTGGDTVRIWTQGHEVGQLFKVAGTGIGRVRRELGADARGRFGVYVDRAKVSNLDKPVQELTGQGINQIVVVDDKAENVLGIREKVKDLKENGVIGEDVDVQAVWTRQGSYRDRVPAGWSIEEFCNQFTVINEISELKKLSEQKGGGVGWLIDFDHTLLDTSRYHGVLYTHQALIVDGLDEHVDGRVVYTAGLSGKIKTIQPLVSGMSGGKVAKVEKTDGEEVVLKTNKQEPHKVRAENDAYANLKSSQLARYLLDPVTFHPEPAALIMPFFPGVELRKSLQSGDIDLKTAMNVSAELFAVKRMWWQGQNKVTGVREYKSMQRTEWNDTKAQLGGVLEQVALGFGLPADDLKYRQINYRGRLLPSITGVMDHVQKQLEMDPEYVIHVHGDATGANILINPQNGVWKLIDNEWSGMADPAESLVRMVKQESTTTARNLAVESLSVEDDSVMARMDFDFHPYASALHWYGLDKVPEFEEVLKDPGFEGRFYSYLAGSYLRELALSTKRGNTGTAVLAMVLAAGAMDRVNQLGERRAA